MKHIRFCVLTMLLAASVSTAWANESEYIIHSTLSSYGSSYYMVAKDGSLYYMNYKNSEPNQNDELASDELEPVKFMDNVLSVSGNYALKEDGTVWSWDCEDYAPELVMDDAIGVFASVTHALIIKSDHSLWGVGANGAGQLAQGEIIYKGNASEDFDWNLNAECIPSYYNEPVKIMDNVKSAAVSWATSYVLKDDNTLWSFGNSLVGQLGNGSKGTVNNIPTKIMDNVKYVFADGYAGFAITDDEKDTLWRWGSFQNGYIHPYFEILPVQYANGAKSVHVKTKYCYLIKTDNSLWLYGETEDSAEGPLMIKEKLPVKLADNVNCTNGTATESIEYERELVLQNTGELYMVDFPEDGGHIFTKLKNNIRLVGELPVEVKFEDTKTLTDNEQQAINALAKASIINGDTEATFSPNKNVTRAEIAAMLLRMTGKKDEEDAPDFEDVTPNEWYYNIVGASQKYNIIKGYDDNTFRGEENVSGLQLISLVARVLNAESIQSVTDTAPQIPANVPAWAMDDVKTAVNGGLIIPEEAEEFTGKKEITRSEAAVILYRLYNKI